MNNPEVSYYLDTLQHPLKKELCSIRGHIMTDFPELTEIIKWNAPSYRYGDTDFLTFNLAKPTEIKLIFHRGAKNREQPSNRLIEDQSHLLKWASNDRAVITFASGNDVILHKENLTTIIEAWINKL